MDASNSDVRMRRAAIIHNPTKENGDALLWAATTASLAAGWAKPMWLETSADDGGISATAEALEAGVDVIIASGGDGTVRCVAESLRGTGTPLALAPAGTGNLLARNLELPLTDVERAIDIALNGSTRSVDLGIAAMTTPDGGVSRHAFTVMAGLGLDAAMIANTKPHLKKRFGWVAYADSAVRSVRKVGQVAIHYTVSGQPERRAHVSTVLVGNCGMLQAGLPLIPDARIDDGELDVAVMQPRNLLGWLLVWRRVAWENRVLRRTSLGREIIRLTGTDRSRQVLTYLRGEAVHIRTDEQQPIELDGDEFGEVVDVTFSVEPGALLVRVADPA